MTNSRYTAIIADEQRLTWEPEELQKALAERRAEFDAQYKLLMASLEKPFRTIVWERSAASIEADARLKALQEYVRNLPPRNSISN